RSPGWGLWRALRLFLSPPPKSLTRGKNASRRVSEVTPGSRPAILAPSLAAQEQQGSPKDSVRKLAPVSIVATPSGRDQTRGANAIVKTELKERAAGTSALKAVEKLPGVNMQSSDPWGSYEWANSITIRGFGTRQIGQTF